MGLICGPSTPSRMKVSKSRARVPTPSVLGRQRRFWGPPFPKGILNRISRRLFSIFFFLVNYQVNFLLFSFSLVVFDCRAPPAPPGEDSCSAAQGVERMSSAMRVDRRTEVVVKLWCIVASRCVELDSGSAFRRHFLRRSFDF